MVGLSFFLFSAMLATWCIVLPIYAVDIKRNIRSKRKDVVSRKALIAVREVMDVDDVSELDNILIFKGQLLLPANIALDHLNLVLGERSSAAIQDDEKFGTVITLKPKRKVRKLRITPPHQMANAR